MTIVHGGSPNPVRCAPAPDWVDVAPFALRVPDSADDYTLNGVCRLLFDAQSNLTSAEPGWYTRTARRVLTRAGAEQVAHMAVEFDPGYERLDVHHVRVLRGDEVIEHAKPDAIQTFRRETSLERLTLNGRLTATLLIPDVRVDDIIECSFTIYGSHPVLEGKYTTWNVFDCFAPWLETRYRLLRPNTRDILVKPFNDPPSCAVVESDGVSDMRWFLAGQKRRDAEDYTPPWIVLAPALHHTEFSNWDDVAKLFVSHYQDAAIPDSLAEEVDRLAALHPEPADFAAEWLRFVQQGLRYFALSLGEGGLIPRQVDAIWTSRFGDCKDAAKLFVAGARRKGLDACAALVSTMLGPSIDSFLPSPAIFNHCIVRVRLSGVSYWLDPTCQAQGGTLGNIFQPHAGWALPLTPDADGLEQLGDPPPVHLIHCEDEIHIGPKVDSPAQFRRTTEYFSASADAIRNRIANEGAGEYTRQALKDVQSVWSGATESSPIEIRDDPAKNIFTVTIGYELRDHWKKENEFLIFDYVEATLPAELGPVQTSARRTDIWLAHPRTITHSVRVHMPYRWSATGWTYEAEAPGLRFDEHVEISGRTITSSKELVISAWSLRAKDADTYAEIVGKLRTNVLKTSARASFGKLRPATGYGGLGSYKTWLVFVALVIILTLARTAIEFANRPAPKAVEPARPNAPKAWQPPAGTVWPSPNSGPVLPR